MRLDFNKPNATHIIRPSSTDVE